MSKLALALLFALVLAACLYQTVNEKVVLLPNSSPTSLPLVFKLEKDWEGAKALPTPTPEPRVLFSAAEVAEGQVELWIPAISVTGPIEVAQEEIEENGPVFTKPGENPLWIPNWGAEIGAEGVALVYGHRQWGPIPKIFTDLDKIKPGNIIKVSNGEKVLFFVVLDTIVIEPEEFWEVFFARDDQALKDGISQIALLTCTPWGTDQQRLIVFAQQLQDF